MTTNNNTAPDASAATTAATAAANNQTLIIPIGSNSEAGPAAPVKSVRLQSLDVMRGITIAWMIFVDNVGETWPSVDHSPWDGASPADFVMPNFDFMVGVAAVFSLASYTSPSATNGDRCAATRKILVRFLRIFVVGIATQCGVSLFVYDLTKLRIMGILQRVACCYLVSALAEVWTCCGGGARGGGRAESSSFCALVADQLAVVRLYVSQFVVGTLLVALHLAILYGVDVPDFVSANSTNSSAPNTTISCGRGVLTPACNAAAHVDRLFFGVNHMYFPTNGGGDGRDVTFQRLPECSTCYPGACGNYSAGLWIPGKRAGLLCLCGRRGGEASLCARFLVARLFVTVAEASNSGNSCDGVCRAGRRVGECFGLSRLAVKR
jgi:hypothetical protein